VSLFHFCGSWRKFVLRDRPTSAIKASPRTAGLVEVLFGGWFLEGFGLQASYNDLSCCWAAGLLDLVLAGWLFDGSSAGLLFCFWWCFGAAEKKWNGGEKNG
jgi:hypothetical protein